MTARSRVAVLAAAALVTSALPTSRAAAGTPSLGGAQRTALVQYLGAIRDRRYGDAFALLDSAEQKYFVTPSNFQSIFDADRLVIERFALGKVVASAAGAVVTVAERVTFDDHAHGVIAEADVKADYGLIKQGSAYRVHDPFHPWRAYDPKGASVESGGVRIIVRKLSFYTGRIELMLSFLNVGDGVVTLLPYGRTVLKDERGTVYQPIDVLDGRFTDRQLRLGLRLPASAQYTGFLAFATPDRFAPKSLQLRIGPQLRDGADEPFMLDLPQIDAGP